MQHQPLLPSRRGFLVASGLASVPVLWATPALAGAARSGTAPPRRAGTTTSVTLPWYDLTNQTVTAAAFRKATTQSRTWALSWLAAARAAGLHRDPGYTTAAFAQALHDTLATQVPSQQPQLVPALAAPLAGVPDGPAKQAGIAAGQQQAAAVLAERQGDGTDTASLDIPYAPPPAGPGIWQPTPPAFGPAVRAGQGSARPFLLARNDQFDPGPPPALTSPAYVGALGSNCGQQHRLSTPTAGRHPVSVPPNRRRPS